MRVSSRYNQVTLGSDKPAELLEPKNLSLGDVFTEYFILFLLYLFQGLFLSLFENLLTGFLSSLLFLEILLLAFIVHCGVGVGIVVDVNLNRE